MQDKGQCRDKVTVVVLIMVAEAVAGGCAVAADGVIVAHYTKHTLQDVFGPPPDLSAAKVSTAPPPCSAPSSLGVTQLALP